MTAVSVVIATLGEGLLPKTIQALNAGTVKPTEILICIPTKEALSFIPPNYDNIKVVSTSCRGQVSQRAIGFTLATADLVLQLDDDIIVDQDCLAQLVNVLSECDSKSISVGPALTDLDTGLSIYWREAPRSLLLKIYYWLMNGKRGYAPGMIAKSGSPFGIDISASDQLRHRVEWLPGGCVLHFRSNLIVKNFYPFSGKAYYEDVIHSHLLNEKGVNLYVIKSAIARLHSDEKNITSLKQFSVDCIGDYRARLHLLTVKESFSCRFYLFYLAMVAHFISNKVRRLSDAWLRR